MHSGSTWLTCDVIKLSVTFCFVFLLFCWHCQRGLFVHRVRSRCAADSEPNHDCFEEAISAQDDRPDGEEESGGRSFACAEGAADDA